MSYELTPENVALEYGQSQYGSRVKFLQAEIEELLNQEREACAAIIEELMVEVENYSNGSFPTEEHTNRAIFSYLETAYSRIVRRVTRK